jgi:hypothetical protein
MELPGADKLIVEREKIMDYLLNESHPDNSGKAEFFLDYGFKRSRWQQMAAALRNAAGNHSVSKTMASPHGTKYIVESRMDTPSGKTPWVRTVWIVDLGQDKPRLVTAYPYEE